MDSHEPYQKSDTAMAVDPRVLRGLVQRRGFLALAVFAVVLGSIVAFTWTQTPTYTASVQLLIHPATNRATGSSTEAIPEVEQLVGGEPRDVATQQRMLQDPGLLQRAVATLDLAGDSLLATTVQVAAGKGTDVLVLQVSDTDPKRAADIANAIAETHVQEAQSGSQNTARRAAEFIRERLSEMGKELAEKKDAVRDYKMAYGVSDLTTERSTGTISVSALTEQAAQADAESAAARSTAAAYRRKLADQKQTVNTETESMRNPARDQITAKLAELTAQRANLALTKGPDHPEILSIDGQITYYQGELAKAPETVSSTSKEGLNPLHQELMQKIADAESEEIAASARAEALRAEASRRAAQLAELPTFEAQLGQLEQASLVAEEMYAALLKQYQQVQIQEATTPPIVEVISPAREPLHPVSPKKLLNLAIGLVLALVLAAIAGGVAEVTDDRIRTSWQAQSALGLPSLGVVPAVARGRELLTAESPSPGVADVFSALRASLRYSSPDGMPKTVMVTSPSTGDGKTTAAVNLASAIADSGLRTVLVCADLRNADTHTKAGASGDQGLTDVLVGQSDLRTCLQSARGSNLWVLLPGTPPPSPVDLIDSDKMRLTLETLKGQFDAVILDTPSCDQYSDPVLLAPACDAVLLVVRIGFTSMRVAEGALTKLERTGCHILGLLSNGVKMRSR